LTVKNISELLDSLSAKSPENLLNQAGLPAPSGSNTSPGGDTFGQVIAKLSSQQQGSQPGNPAVTNTSNNSSPAPVIPTTQTPGTVPVAGPTAVVPVENANPSANLATTTVGSGQASQDTLRVSETLRGVNSAQLPAIEKAFFAMASSLANLLSQAQQLTGENSAQIQAQLVAQSGGQITTAEASQLVSAVQSFVQNLPQEQNPLDLNKNDQNQLLGQMLQQMLQNQQVMFALNPNPIQSDNANDGGTQGVAGVSQANALSNVTLRFLFTEGQINQSQAAGAQANGLAVNFQTATLSVSTQTFENQAQPLTTGLGAANQPTVLANTPALTATSNFQAIPQDRVNTLLSALSQLGAQPTNTLPVTIVNPTVSAQNDQAAQSQNLQALFKVLLQAGAGPVMLQSAVLQQGTTTNNPNAQAANQANNPFAQIAANLQGAVQTIAVQPLANTQNAGNPTINQNPNPVPTGTQEMVQASAPVETQPVVPPVPQNQLPVIQPLENIQVPLTVQNPASAAGAQNVINANPTPQTQGTTFAAQPQVQAAPNTAKPSIWSSLNFRRINELVLRFTAFIGPSNTTVANPTLNSQGPAQIAVANSPSAITAQVGASIGPEDSPVSINMLPNGEQQEVVDNSLTPNTVQIQAPPIPNGPAVSAVRLESQSQTHLSQSLLSNQTAQSQVLDQSPLPGSALITQAQTSGNPPVTPTAQTQAVNNPLVPANAGSPVLEPINNTLTNNIPVTGPTNPAAPNPGIIPAPAPAVTGTPITPGTPVVVVPQAIPLENAVPAPVINPVNQTLSPVNQAAIPGLSAPPVSLAQNLAGSVAAVNVFNEGMAQNQSNPTQTPLVANPVQPSETVPSITPQAVTAVSTLGETEKVQSVSLQDKNSFADQLSTQNPTNPSASGVFYTLGKNGEVQAVNPAGNQIPVNAQDLISQISNQVSTKSGELKSVSTINFQLVPENLGRMTIQVSLVDQSVSARILVTNPDVKDALQQHLVDLKTSLNQAGLQIDQLQVQVQGGGASLLSQYYQFQQEGYGSSLPTFGSTEMGNLGENEAVSGPLSVRKSLVNLLA
jgi:flagellar hook-length control protein FliK